MQKLKELLETAVSRTKYDMGQVEVRSDRTHYSYGLRPGEVIDSDKFRTIVNANNWDDEFISVQSARIVVPDEPLSRLNGFLHELLVEYIDPDTDRVGHAFPVNGRDSHRSISLEANGLKRTAFVSGVGDIAHALVRGAAVLGADRVSELVFGWLQGAPVEYRTSTLIGELYIEEPIVPLDGVYISPLPRSSNKLPGNLSHFGLRRSDFLGRTVASLSTCARPAFLHPDDVGPDNGIEIATASGLGFSQICLALSLISDSHVEPGIFWNDYHELSALCLSPEASIWSFLNSRSSRPLPSGTTRKFGHPTEGDTVVLPQGSIADIAPKECRDTLEAVASMNSRGLSLALERWSRSKRSVSTLEDSFVDLRIAMEALFLKGFTNKYSQEMRFRLALHGAWFLGADFKERQEVWETLRKAYDSASGVVHGRELKGDQESQECNRLLLLRAQDLCRRGILKLIREGMPNSEEWGNLILGSDLASS